MTNENINDEGSMSSKDTDWSEWPKCIQCRYTAYRSNHVPKAKCMYHYKNGTPQANICDTCLGQYRKEEEFSQLEGVYICKLHYPCLMFESKMAKYNYDRDELAQEEFKEMKTIVEDQEVPLKQDKGWMTKDDIHQILVDQNKEFDPNSFEFQNNSEIQRAKQEFDQLKGPEVQNVDVDMQIDQLINEVTNINFQEASSIETDLENSETIAFAQCLS